MNRMPQLPSHFLTQMWSCLRWLALMSLLQWAASPALAAKTYLNNGDGTVTDSATSLVWMRCSMGQTWNGPASTCTGAALGYTWEQANALTGTVIFAGQSDWRMPNIRELQSIVDRTVSDPSIDTVAFVNTPAAHFWSASASANESINAWRVGFFNGGASNGYSRSEAYHVRLVRGGQPLGLLDITRPATDYADQGNGTVLHTPTQLVWQRCAVGQTWIWTDSSCSGTASIHTWEAAKLLTSTLAGHGDWRLPTQEELLSLVDYKRSLPAINGPLFPNSPIATWSSSPNVLYSRYPWYVDFRAGVDSGYDNAFPLSVRLVRTATAPARSMNLTPILMLLLD
ncbi:MAG: DUF1566 domain-containing protein [Comamonadaceae bacterium]|nr:DUF1566 domain-containing protein [Comamonadaceae bacterium]